MLIVIVIIGILAAALLPQIWSARDKANDTAREANVRTLVTAITQLWMDSTDWYPETLNTWALEKYGVPTDNFDDTPDGTTYTYVKLKWDHFLVVANLSCEDDDEPECGNCTVSTVTAYTGGTVWTEAAFVKNDGDDLDWFCQIQ